MTTGAGLVAITGATGFLGRRLAPALMASGWRVRALVRRPSPGIWGAASPEIVTGDLDDPAALAAVTEDADVVIHAAGLIKARDRAAFFKVNEAGTARLAEAARGARVLQVSSLAAREPALSDYAASKFAGETAARRILDNRLMVIRPPAIYGPGDRETLSLFQAASNSPVMPLPSDRNARLALAHVDDVVALIDACLRRSWMPGTFAVGGARPAGYAWREIFDTAAAAVGRHPMLFPVPAWALATAGAVSETVGRIRGEPAIFNRGKVRELLHPDWSVSADDQVPGVRTPFRQITSGFQDTIAWYRAEGWLP